MNRFRALLIALTICPIVTAQSWPRTENDGEQSARQRWFYEQRAYPYGSIPAGARADAVRAIDRIDSATRLQHLAAARAAPSAGSLAITLDSANWTLIGPMPTG